MKDLEQKATDYVFSQSIEIVVLIAVCVTLFLGIWWILSQKFITDKQINATMQDLFVINAGLKDTITSNYTAVQNLITEQVSTRTKIDNVTKNQERLEQAVIKLTEQVGKLGS